MLTWLQVSPMVLRDEAAAETTSVLLTKPLLTVPYLRHRTPLWGPGSIPDNWQTSVDSLRHRVLIVIGKCACIVPAKPSIYVQTIRVAITRLDFLWISSIDATLAHSMVNMIDKCLSKNVLQRVHTGTKNDVLAKS